MAETDRPQPNKWQDPSYESTDDTIYWKRKGLDEFVEWLQLNGFGNMIESVVVDDLTVTVKYDLSLLQPDIMQELKNMEVDNGI